MDIELVNVSCNFCGSTSYVKFFSRGDLNTFLPGIFTLVQCTTCGLVYQNPRPSEKDWEYIYPDEYDQYVSIPSKMNTLENIFRRYGLLKRIRSIEKYIKKGTLCDLGCSTGEFLFELKDHPGWNVFGIEPSTIASQYAREQGLNVYSGTLDENIQNIPEINVLTMWNVIEHLPDPLHTLRMIRSRMSPNGLLVFTTPNLDSFDAKLFGKYWIGYELPRHFYVFSMKTISYLLDAAGFTLLDTKCLFGSHAATMSSLRFWIRSKYPALPKKAEDILFSPFFRVVLSPFFTILDKTKKSSPITIFAQKR